MQGAVPIIILFQKGTIGSIPPTTSFRSSSWSYPIFCFFFFFLNWEYCGKSIPQTIDGKRRWVLRLIVVIFWRALIFDVVTISCGDRYIMHHEELMLPVVFVLIIISGLSGIMRLFVVYFVYANFLGVQSSCCLCVVFKAMKRGSLKLLSISILFYRYNVAC